MEELSLKKNKQQPDQRKARAEVYNGKIPNPGQKINDKSTDKKP
jgi:hypothetical protein